MGSREDTNQFVYFNRVSMRAPSLIGRQQFSSQTWRAPILNGVMRLLVWCYRCDESTEPPQKKGARLVGKVFGSGIFDSPATILYFIWESNIRI